MIEGTLLFKTLFIHANQDITCMEQQMGPATSTYEQLAMS